MRLINKQSLGPMTANTYADASLFSLREAVAKLANSSVMDGAQTDAQNLGIGRLLPPLPDTLCHEQSKTEEWCPRQDLNLYDITH
jgi:hypothetical protein